MKKMIISLVACLGFSFSVIASDFTLHQESFNSSDFGNIQNYMDEQNPDNVSNILCLIAMIIQVFGYTK